MSGDRRLPRWRDGIPRCSEQGCPRYNLRGTCSEMAGRSPAELCEPEVRAQIALGQHSAREGVALAGRVRELEQEVRAQIALGQHSAREGVALAGRVRELEQGARAVAAALEVLGDGADKFDSNASEPQCLGDCLRDRAAELRLLAQKRGQA